MGRTPAQPGRSTSGALFPAARSLRGWRFLGALPGEAVVGREAEGVFDDANGRGGVADAPDYLHDIKTVIQVRIPSVAEERGSRTTKRPAL